ncbi:hypothetical protein ABGB09_02530 [Streptomyces sp. B8F3]|uniref:hypothetical protein n=1 Tax=Streptomyces sp. B8F3 TaxID=3153573 RepID=UPI00325CFEDE
MLGDITEIDARTELLWPQVKLVDTGAISVREVPDHLDAIAKTSSGAPVGVQILAGVPASDAHFSLDVRGSDGWLKLTGDHPAGVQVGDLALSSSVDFTAPDSPLATGTGATAAEIGGAPPSTRARCTPAWRATSPTGPTTPRDSTTPSTTAA